MEGTPCPLHSGIDAQLHDIERRLNTGEKRMTDIEKAIKEMHGGLLSRPSWGVALLLTGLTTLCVALLVALVARAF